jgi:hypothetical protein
MILHYFGGFLRNFIVILKKSKKCLKIDPGSYNKFQL